MITKVYYALATGNFTDSSTQGLLINEFNFPAPTVKTQYVDVPGRDGLIDLSESLTGEPVYQNVKGSITFIVLKGANFNLDTFINTYHGKIMRFYTDEQPNYYRIGRATVTGKTLRLGKLQTFTVSVDVEPLLWKLTESTVSIPIAAYSAADLVYQTSTNMNVSYPTVSGASISLRASGTAAATATYQLPVTPGKSYVAHAEKNAYCGDYTVTRGSYTYTNAAFFTVPSNAQAYVTVKFSTIGNDSTHVATFSKFTLIEMTPIPRDQTSTKTTIPQVVSTRAATLYVGVSGEQGSVAVATPVTANKAVNVYQIKPTEGTSANVKYYIGFGGASLSGTGTLTYRGGVLS